MSPTIRSVASSQGTDGPGSKLRPGEDDVMRSTRLCSTWIVAGALGASMVATAGPASATYPGSTDGRLASFRFEDGNGDIYSVMPDGQGAHRLTTDPSFDACPSYSPDGKWIAFCSDRGPGDGFEIWTMRHNGTRQTRVTHLGGYATFPDFSPDGSRIAFEAGRIPGGPEASDIYTIGTDGTGLQRLTDHPDWELNPVWSPDGSQIAYGRETAHAGPQLFLMDADGSNQRQITALPAGAFEPDWSPDGNKLAFESDWRIHVLDLTTGVVTAVGDVVGFGAVWSPTGDRIAFVHFPDGDPDKPRQVATMATDGTDLQGVAPTRGVPTWQARGDRTG